MDEFMLHKNCPLNGELLASLKAMNILKWGFPLWLSVIRMQHTVREDAGLILALLGGLRIWCCCNLWCALQMWLGSVT